jgi:uncharacterized membrane protein
MRYTTFRKLQAIMGMIIGGVTGVSVAVGNWIVPVFIIIICVLIMMSLRRRVKEIVNDERTYAIAEKAARLTIQIIAIGMAIAGAILLVISRGKSPVITQAGFALEYATCALLIINYIAYYYYSKKLSGR